MTTAPTPSEKVQRLAITLEIVGAVPDMHYVTVPRHVARDASVELRRLQAENERLLAQVHKLEMDALDLASENSILKRAEVDELEARKPLPLSYRAGAMTSSIDGAPRSACTSTTWPRPRRGSWGSRTSTTPRSHPKPPARCRTSPEDHHEDGQAQRT